MRKKNRLLAPFDAIDAERRYLANLSSVHNLGRAKEMVTEAGQQSLIDSDALPSDMCSDIRRQLDEAGGVIHEPVPGDDRFVFAILPDGWYKTWTTDHCWSELRDGSDRLRARIYYRAGEWYERPYAYAA